MSDEKVLLELVKAHIEDDRRVHGNYVKLLEKISDQTKETQDCVNKLDKKLDLSIQKVEFEIKEINKLDQRQNESLERHIAGVKGNTELIQQHRKEWDRRLQELEDSKIWKKMTWKKIVALSGGITLFATMIAAIGKAIPYLIKWLF